MDNTNTEVLIEALTRLRNECDLEGLRSRAGFDCWLNLADEAIAAWNRRASHPVVQVPLGWKLVPIEPTDLMQGAFFDVGAAGWKAAYQACIAAAPSPTPQGGGDPVAYVPPRTFCSEEE